MVEKGIYSNISVVKKSIFIKNKGNEEIDINL